MRIAFYVSDGTALTAGTFGHALLSMFPVQIEHQILPFVDTIEKAENACRKIEEAFQETGEAPLIFHTFVNTGLKEILLKGPGVSYDFLDYFVAPLSRELGVSAQPKTHRTHGMHPNYNFRIAAIDYSLASDDGGNSRNYDNADIILIGVSRTGKTPTSLYLALQYGIKAANYPITEDDHMENLKLPRLLAPYRHKLFGLTLEPSHLHEIRSKRRESSRYASLQQCRFEISEVEKMYRRSAIPFIDSTYFSVEEIAAKILAETNLERRQY